MGARSAGILLLLVALAAAPARGGEAEEFQEYVAQLVAKLGAPDYRARESATKELRTIGRPALKALKQALKSKDTEIRARAERLVREIRWTLPPGLARGLGKLGEGFTGKYLAAGPQQRASMLEQLRRRAPREAESYLLQALEEETESKCRKRLVTLLGSYSSPPVRAAVMAATRDKHAAVRQEAARILAKHPGEAVLGRLVELIADQDKSVRSRALWGIGSRGRAARKVAGAVIKALGDPEDEVKGGAAGALGRIGDKTMIRHLWKLAERPGESEARWDAIAAIQALAEPGDRAVAGRLARMLDAPEPEVLVWVICALRNMRARSAAGRLAEFLDDPRVQARLGAKGLARVRPVAVWTFGFIGGKEQAPTMRRILNQDADRRVAGLTAGVLLYLGQSVEERRVRDLLAGPRPAVAGQTAAGLALGGDPRWIKVIREAEKSARSEKAKQRLVQLRAESFRDPAAFGARVRAFRARDDWERTRLMRRFALFADAVKLHEGRKAGLRRGTMRGPDLGEALVRAGRAREGLAALRGALEREPYDSSALEKLARALLTSPRAEFRDPKAALKAAGRAANIVERYWCAHTVVLDLRAWALFRSGRKAEALKQSGAALFWVGPDDDRARGFFEARRARILAGLGRKEESRGMVRAARKHVKFDPQAAAEVARACCDLGDAEGALEMLGRMLDLTYPDLEMLRNDPDLAPARKHEGFKALLERAEKLREEMLAEIFPPPAGKGKPGKR